MNCPNCASATTTVIGYYHIQVALDDFVDIEQWECLDCEHEFEVS